MKEMNEKPNHDQKCERDIQHIIAFPIATLKMLGMWRSNEWSSFFKLFYSIMTFIPFSFMILDLITVLFLVHFSETPTRTFFKISFHIASVLVALCKALGVVFKHDKIVLLLKMLVEDQCIPRDSEEIAIQNKTDNHSRLVFKVYASMLFIALIAIYMEPILVSGDERVRSLYIYRPFDLNVPLYFWLSYFQIIITHATTPLVHMSVECLIAGLMNQACAQIKILQHRLRKMPGSVAKYKKQKEYKHIDIEYILFTENVKHHMHILQCTQLLNQTFVEILFFQCLMSSALICCSIYQVATENLFSFYFINALLFNMCMMVQLFLFCFYGNELSFQSTLIKQTLFEMDWTSLRSDTKNNIITMMICTSKPIVISSGSVIKIDLATFLFIINASYSAFNVLQQTVKK